jgi:hypothetical protein
MMYTHPLFFMLSSNTSRSSGQEGGLEVSGRLRVALVRILLVDSFTVPVDPSKISRSVIVALNLPSAMAINDIFNFVWVSEPINFDLHTSLAR